MTLFHSPSVQSPKAYDLANLTGPQIQARLTAPGISNTLATGVTAAVRGNLAAALQDIGYRYRIHPVEASAGLIETNLNFGFDVCAPDRYALNVSPGATPMGTAAQTAVNIAKRKGGTVSFDDGPYLLDKPVDCTDPAGFVTAITQATSAVVTFNLVSAANPFYIGQVANFTGVLGMTQINAATGIITALGGASGAWTVTTNINSLGFSAYTSGGLVFSQNCSFAIVGRGRFKAPTNSQGQLLTPTILLKHTGHAFDTTGSNGIHFENISIATDDVTYPKTCFLLARNALGASRSDRFVNCYVYGRLSNTILYNFGSEDGMYSGCQFYNTSADANTSVLDITEYNARAITSAFTQIQTVTPVSCLDHKIFGGEFANLFQGSGATADVFRFEGARQIKVYGPWMDSSAKAGGTSGRSLIYLDGTNAPTQGLFLHGIDGEAAVPPALYGILISNNAQSHSNIVVEGCWLPSVTSMLGGGGGSTITALTWINSTAAGGSGAITFGGGLLSPFLDGSAGTVVAASIDTFANTLTGGALVQANGEVDFHLRDYSQASGSQWKKLRNTGGALVVSACNDAGVPTASNVQFNTSGTTQMLGKLYGVQDNGAPQTTAGMYAGSGVPSNANGSNGDFYLRGDTPGTANQRLYVKSAGAWIGIL